MEAVDDQNLLSQGNNYNICWKEAFPFLMWHNTWALVDLSLRTTERRLQELSISSGQFFTTIDSETLDRTVETILRSFPSYDYRRMTGSLLSGKFNKFVYEKG